MEIELKRPTKKLEPVPYTTAHIMEKTGDWSVFKPLVKKELCRKCMICLDFCPDGAIYETEGLIGIDYDYCKGCGICTNECPYKAIEMAEEH